MRRIHIAGILVFFIVLIAAGTAFAHPGLEDPYVPANRLTAVVMGVPSEQQAPMVEVDIWLPASFTLKRVDPTPGWQSSSPPGQLKFTGTAPTGQYVQFNFAGIFAQKAVLEIPVTTRAADGTAQTWDGGPTSSFPASLAFPGYARGTAPIPGVTTSTPSGRRALVWTGRLLVVLGAIVLAAVFMARRRRDRAASRR